MYCTYITFYRGNQLPPFYIGYTSVNNISRGYNGSVSSKKYKSIWKQEREDKPYLFRTVILSTFVTRGEALEHEERLLQGLQVHKNDLYINMSIAGRRFTPVAEGTFKGKTHTEETKDKMRVGHKLAWENMNPEERSARAKKSIHNITPAQHSARGKKAAKTRLQHTSPEEHSARAKKGWEGMTPEERSARNKKGWENMTPEERSARAKSAWEARRLNTGYR